MTQKAFDKIAAGLADARAVAAEDALVEAVARVFKPRNGCDHHEGCEDKTTPGGCACRDDASAAIAAARPAIEAEAYRRALQVIENRREDCGGGDYRVSDAVRDEWAEIEESLRALIPEVPS